MANWKKIIVSGSSAELAALKVDNLSSGVVTGAAGNLTTTAVNGTGNIVATTGATNVVMTGSFTGSFAGDGSGLTGVVAAAGFSLTQGEGISSFSYNGASAQTVAISGAAQLSDNAITKWNNTDGKFVNSSITDNGSTITGATSIQLTGASSVITGSFTGSFAGDGSGLTGIAANLAVTGSNGSSGSVNLKTQGLTITGTSNEIETSVSNQTVTIGLPNDIIVSNDLTVLGDLTVAGTASFNNQTSLLIADRFALLASGSSTLTDGGIIVSSGPGYSGSAWYLESTSAGAYGRWAVAPNVDAAASSATPDEFGVTAKLSAASAPSDAVPPTWGGSSNGAGNIWVKQDTGDIFIWS